MRKKKYFCLMKKLCFVNQLFKEGHSHQMIDSALEHNSINDVEYHNSLAMKSIKRVMKTKK